MWIWVLLVNTVVQSIIFWFVHRTRLKYVSASYILLLRWLLFFSASSFIVNACTFVGVWSWSRSWKRRSPSTSLMMSQISFFSRKYSFVWPTRPRSWVWAVPLRSRVQSFKILWSHYCFTRFLLQGIIVLNIFVATWSNLGIASSISVALVSSPSVVFAKCPS